MSDLSRLEKHYPELDRSKLEQLKSFEQLLLETNRRVNLISRKEEDPLLRHIIPSLFPMKWLDPPAHALVADIGTGGGLPGIPMAIAYPGMEFLLIDSTRKKLDAIEEMVEELGIENVRTEHQRVEQACFEADLILGRAVMGLPRFVALCREHLRSTFSEKGQQGILYWTGGELEATLEGIEGDTEIHAMADHLNAPELSSKKIVFVTAF